MHGKGRQFLAPAPQRQEGPHVSRGCSQTDANSSQFSRTTNLLGREETAPLGESGGAVLLEILSAIEVTLRVEEVVN